MNIPKRTKNVLYTVLLLIMAFFLFYALNQYFGSKIKYANMPLSEIIKLPEQERKFALEQQVKVLAKKVEDFNENTTADLKYSTYIKLSEAQLEIGQNQEALNSLNAIPEEKRNNSRYAAAQIKATFRVGDTSKARETAFNNILLYEEDAAVWVGYFEAFADTPSSELTEAYKKAIDKTKSNVDVMMSYAKFSEKIGDKATAIAAWETAANVDPANEGKYREEIARLRQ